MKRLALGAAALGLALTGCSSTDDGQSTAQGKPGVEGAGEAKTGPEQSFTYSDDYGYSWRITVAVGEFGPTIHANNCIQGGFDAAPGKINVALKLSITNLLEDRRAPVPTSLRLEVPGREFESVMIGPDDQEDFSCDGSVSIGRWFQPGEKVGMTGYARNIPEPIAADAVVVFQDGSSESTVGPRVELAHG
jgi:hypothetical protein